MPFHEDDHMSGRNIVEAYGACDNMYLRAFVGFDITQHEMFVCKRNLQHTNSQLFNRN